MVNTRAYRIGGVIVVTELVDEKLADNRWCFAILEANLGDSSEEALPYPRFSQSPKIVENEDIHTLRTKYSERSEKSLGLGTYLCENKSWLGSSGS